MTSRLRGRMPNGERPWACLPRGYGCAVDSAAHATLDFQFDFETRDSLAL
jgi:hypothetical protein